MTNHTTEAAAISDATQWREAASALIEFWTVQDRCYSSGEIAACLRTHRMDLKFAVASIGEYVRSRFCGGDTDGVPVTSLPCYDDGQGRPLAPIQHVRYTMGSGRTPADVLVFVYGPSVDDCDVHDFEVDIPCPNCPNGQITDGPQTPAPVLSAPASQTQTRRPMPANLPPAYVGKDLRCYIGRKVVDAYLSEANVSLRQGDCLYVSFDGTTITAEETHKSQPYDVWKGSGRVAFLAPNGIPYVEGAKYPLSVSKNGIVVDLTARL